MNHVTNCFQRSNKTAPLLRVLRRARFQQKALRSKSNRHHVSRYPGPSGTQLWLQHHLPPTPKSPGPLRLSNLRHAQPPQQLRHPPFQQPLLRQSVPQIRLQHRSLLPQPPLPPPRPSKRSYVLLPSYAHPIIHQSAPHDPRICMLRHAS